VCKEACDNPKHLGEKRKKEVNLNTKEKEKEIMENSY
jgi:hypothetical protein